MLSQETVGEYLSAHGSRGKRVIERLARLHNTRDAIETKAGEEILNMIVPEMESLLEKIIDLSATEEEKIRFAVYKDFATKVMAILSNYAKTVQAVQEMRLP